MYVCTISGKHGKTLLIHVFRNLEHRETGRELIHKLKQAAAYLVFSSKLSLCGDWRLEWQTVGIKDIVIVVTLCCCLSCIK